MVFSFVLLEDKDVSLYLLLLKHMMESSPAARFLLFSTAYIRVGKDSVKRQGIFSSPGAQQKSAETTELKLQILSVIIIIITLCRLPM